MALEALPTDLSATSGWIRNLNAAQLDAVRHRGGPLLIIAGAGSGKTLTLAGRVAHLIESGVAPQRILLLTFTRRAATEMLSRVQALVEPGATARVWGGTFHAIATRMLRMYGSAVGIDPGFTVADQADSADLMNLIRSELHFDTKKSRFARKETLAAIYSATVNAGRPLKDVLEKRFPWCAEDRAAIADVFTRYTERKQATNVLDYDDLLLYWEALTESSMSQRLCEQFSEVLVDEYQDTNAMQSRILTNMHRQVADITVVGDDAQSVYSFRSATVANILDFSHLFNARTIKLEQNYRSTPQLLEASNSVIALSPQRHDKTLWSARAAGAKPALVTCRDELDQAAAVCDSVLEFRERGTPLLRQAVLFRTGHHSDVLEVELSRRNIPFMKYGGLKFLEAAHVKDVIALLRILENPCDAVSWHRSLMLLDGIGPAHARRLMQSLAIDGQTEVPTPLHRLIASPPDVPAVAAESLDRLREALGDCIGDGGRAEPPLPSQIERLRRFIEPVLVSRYSNAEARLADIDQLATLASAARSRLAFLTEMVLDPPGSTSDLAGPPHLDEDYLILSTIHSAKGSEWDVVRIIHAADGMIPSDMATGDADSIEEERRLFYVAMTRARDHLEIYFPQRYYTRPRGRSDRHGYAQLTRFLPDQTRRHFEARVVSHAGEQDGPPVRVSGRPAVGEYLSRLWSEV